MNTQIVEARQLTGTALDWAVAKCEARKIAPIDATTTGIFANDGNGFEYFTPSRDWAQGGPIIERAGIQTQKLTAGGWLARPYSINKLSDRWQAKYRGATLLEAAMRCHVATTLGEWVSVPKELL